MFYSKDMENGLNIIEQEIKKCLPKAPIKRIYFPKLNKTLLCVYLEGSSQSFKLYDETHGSDCVANIVYKIGWNLCQISTFVTIEELQGLGLGRFVYNMALAHADACGITSSYGRIAPTHNIKGVTNPKKMNVGKEFDALKLIYAKLGNKFVDSYDDINFVSKWNNGDRIKTLTNEQLELLKECLSLNKKRRK